MASKYCIRREYVGGYAWEELKNNIPTRHRRHLFNDGCLDNNDIRVVLDANQNHKIDINDFSKLSTYRFNSIYRFLKKHHVDIYAHVATHLPDDFFDQYAKDPSKFHYCLDSERFVKALMQEDARVFERLPKK